MVENWWDGLGYKYVGEWRGVHVFISPWDGRSLEFAEWKYETARVRAAYERFGGDSKSMAIRFVGLEEGALIYDGIIKNSIRAESRPTKTDNLENKGVSEQPEMVAVEGVGYVYERVMEDMRARADMGLKKYGTYLQAHNGRDGLRDAYEEVLDLAVYLRQVIDERDERMKDAGELMKKFGV
jgi:hypothetical protein